MGQTSRATDDIREQIDAIRQATMESVMALQSIRKQMSEIDEISAGINSSVTQYGSSASEIAQSIRATAKGGSDIPSCGHWSTWLAGLVRAGCRLSRCEIRIRFSRHSCLFHYTLKWCNDI